MTRKWIYCKLVLLVLCVIGCHKQPPTLPNYPAQPSFSVIPMPSYRDQDPITSGQNWGQPVAQRGAEYRKYLAASVMIHAGDGGGSGTIIYYDNATGEAYIASCGHLWEGNASAKELANNPPTCRIFVYYHNDTKLSQVQEFQGTVLYYCNDYGYDSSLIKFKPDWEPEFFPIAPLGYNLPVGSHQHSTGCDRGTEVAHYDVEIVGMRGIDLITQQNSPRPGRSGGGLLTDDGYYVGICVRTSDTSGNGVGVFTPLSSIHKMYTENGYAWLLDSIARSIPIFDQDRNMNLSDKDLIPTATPQKIPLQ